METFQISKPCLGYPITATATVLQGGVHLLVVGGCHTHVGAISMAAPGEPARGCERPTHRDQTVSRSFAVVLAALLQQPVTVACGIHYDNATKADLHEILAVCNALLGELAAALLGRTSVTGEDVYAHFN